MIRQLVNNFIERCQKEGSLIEAVALADKDNILIEHHFVRVATRNIYSHTKSVISMAIGVAVKEGIISEDDYLTVVLKKYLKEDYDKGLDKVQLKHLLTMSSGINEALLMNSGFGLPDAEPDYLEWMLSQKVKVEPGSLFCYSNGDTYLAARMLEEKVGYPIQLYLHNHFFKPLGMGNPTIFTDLQGRVFGATGLHLSIANQIKLGQYLLRETEIDDGYFQRMKAPLINVNDNQFWWNEYGYQFWLFKGKPWYRMDGAFGQVTIIMEDIGYCLSVQNPDNEDFGKVIALMNEEILFKL